MINIKKISKRICGICIISSMIFMIYGILKVNFTLPQVAKPSSCFSVIQNENPLEITIDIGKYNVILNGEPFINFVKGIKTIGNSIKDMI